MSANLADILNESILYFFSVAKNTKNGIIDKKERKFTMKRICGLMSAIFILFNLCACGNPDIGEEVGVITQEELAQYSEYIELTTENWSEYFEIKRTESIITDAFGEETGKSIDDYIVLKDGCYISEDNAIRLTYDSDMDETISKRTTDIVFNKSDSRFRTLYCYSGNVTCEKIKGTILRLSIPEGKWAVDDEGRKYIKINGYNRYVYYNSYTVIYDLFVTE